MRKIWTLSLFSLNSFQCYHVNSAFEWFVRVNTTSTHKSTLSVQSTLFCYCCCMPAWLYAFLPATSLSNSTHLRFAYSKNHSGTVVVLRCRYPLPALEVTRDARSLVCEISAHKPKNSPDLSYISFQELAERIWGVINYYFMKSRYLWSWLMCN